MLAAGMAKRFGGGCKPLAPLGLHGEAVIDLTAGDALASGFGVVVLVLGPQTGPAIEYHVRRTWPSSVAVAFTRQEVPLGTAHALLCARAAVGDRPFAVVNADDVYGRPALGTLAGHLTAPGEEHALVGYALADTVVSDDPVTRGTCRVGPDGRLEGIAERRLVTRRPDGTFAAGDGREPEVLDPATLVSMNLWGLRPALWPVLEAAVRAVHPEAAPDGSLAGPPGGTDEVLLPEVVGTVVDGTAPGGHQPVRVLPASGRCVGVTHPGDLPEARRELAVMVARGQRAESPWEGVA